MTRLTEAELAAIEAREKAATPEPWHSRFQLPGHDGYFVGLLTPERAITGRPEHENDYTFIAHARTDVPRLLADLRAVTADTASMTKRYLHHVETCEPEDCGACATEDALRERLRAAQKVVEAARPFTASHRDCGDGCQYETLRAALRAYDASGKGAGDGR